MTQNLRSQLQFSKMRSTSTLTNEKNLNNVSRLCDKIQEKFGLEKIENLKTNHLKTVFKDLQNQGLSNSTLAGYATAARMIASQIHKENIMPRMNKELNISRAGERLQPLTCNTAKQAEITQALYNKSEYLGLAADMRQEFGLRAKESLLSNKIVLDAQGKIFLQVEGSKGGRARTVEIKTQEQRAIINKVQAHIRANEQNSIIPRDQTLKQAITQQRNALSAAGATRADGSNAHAHRHAYAQNRAAEGATRGQIAEELGHGREEIVSHYVPR